MEFRILGPVEIISDTGETLVLAREKERRLLAVLLMNTGHVVSKEKLISRLGDGDSRGVTDGTFRAYLARVKRAVDEAGDAAKLLTREGGYQLLVPDDSVDARRFTRLRHQAGVADRSGDADQAVALLCQAEALWHGAALGGVEGQWALGTGHGLDEERRSCILRRIKLELDLGRHAELIGELRRLRAQYPGDETRAAHEMTALYRSGRQEDALDVYREVRDCLVGQGLEPGPKLVELHQRILHRDLAPADPVREPSSGNAPDVPRRDTAFIGRETDISTLTSPGPGTSGVWVVSGLSGVGKTRLAVEAARRLAGEILFLEFHAKDESREPLGMDEALRCLLELAGANRSVLPSGRAKLGELWQRELASRQLTVILDDVPNADVVRLLLPTAGSCRVFITARQRLHGIAGASEHALDVLSERDAIKLFTEIAGEEAGGSNDIAAAVRRCGRLPIAITIDAGRLRRDGRSLGTTTGVSEVTEPSEASEQLQLVLDSCYQSLAEGERKLFRFLGLNPCPSFTVEAAASIVGLPVDAAREMITVLFDRHLVDHALDGGFRLHDLLRDYAAMIASREISRRDCRDAERRLLDYYLRRADRADHDLYPHRRQASPQSVVPAPRRPNRNLADQARQWLEAEWRNALTVSKYAGRHEWKRYCAELAHLLANFLDMRGYWDVAADVHTQALKACRDLGDQSGAARALVDLSRASLHLGNHQAALAHAQDALDLYRSLGDRRGEAEASDRIGVAHYEAGEFRETLAYEQEARDLYAQIPDLMGEAETVFRCGVACMELGRPEESLNHFRESLDISELSGNVYIMAMALNSLGEVSRRQGYHRDAIVYYRKALLICRSMGAVWESAIVMQNIGHFYLYKGNHDRALAEFKCALAVFRQINDLPGQARAMCDFGDAYLAMDDCEQSLVYYQDAASAAERVGNLHVQLIAMRGIADALRGADRHEESIRQYRDALGIAQRVAAPYQHAAILSGLAETMFRVGQVGAGRIYLRQAFDLYQAAGAIEAESARVRLQALGALPVGDNDLSAGLR